MSLAVALLAKTPLPGRVKTRLAASIGAAKALQLYQAMLVSVLDQLGALSAPLFVYWDAHNHAHPFPTPLIHTPVLHLWQGWGDLGQRIQRVFASLFSQGFHSVVLVGADYPLLCPALLYQCRSRLAVNDVVLGPAVDGGYYLIGMRQYWPALFDDIPWSTDAVLTRTLTQAGQLRCSVHLLPPGQDVDEWSDVLSLARQSGLPKRVDRVLQHWGLR